MDYIYPRDISSVSVPKEYVLIYNAVDEVLICGDGKLNVLELTDKKLKKGKSSAVAPKEVIKKKKKKND